MVLLLTASSDDESASDGNPNPRHSDSPPPSDSPDDDSDGDDPFGDSSDSDGSDNLEDEEEGDPPLYAGAPITVGESMLSVLSLVLAHNLSGTCLVDVLELVAMHCPQPNLCKTSLFKFKKYFSDLKSPLHRRYYCSVCLTSLNAENEGCRRCQGRRGVSYYIQMPIVPQLQSLYARPGFTDKLRYPINRRKQVENNYEDLYDGSVYQRLRNEGNILANDNNISLTWYADGVRIFRSAKEELWPFYLTVNNLSFSERTKIDNTLIAGLWYGPKKPLPSLFLQHTRDDLIQIRNGINVTLPGNEVLLVRGVVMCGIVDLHAKALFLNSKLFNSRWGCSVCKIETVQDQPPLPKRIYPFRFNLTLRTDEETVNFARIAHRTRRPVYGIKGPSALAPFVRRPIEYTSIDVMHQSALGLGKMLGRIWFDKKFHDHAASLLRYVEAIDERLRSICPPDYTQRYPRSIAEHFSFWKAHELKKWLLVYSLVVLEDLLPNQFFQHHKLLVLGLTLLNMESISPEMIEQASVVLTEYVARFQDLYGQTHMSANLHLLLHLPLMTQRFGPLWTTNAAAYENLNGVLKRFVTGTRHANLQIYSAASMFLNLSAFKERILVPGRRPHAFCQKLNNSKRHLTLDMISDRLAVVGKLIRSHDLPVNIRRAIEPLRIENANIFQFHRLFNYKCKMLYTSTAYNRVKRTNSNCVKYSSHGRAWFGEVKDFIRVTECECVDVCHGCGTRFYAIIQQFNTQCAFRVEPGGRIPFIHRSTLIDEYEAVEVEHLMYVCTLLTVNDNSFLIEPCNTVEVE